MRLNDAKVSLQELLLARVVDELAFISWSKTKDGSKNRNRPKSVIKALTEKKEDEVQAFTSAEEFKAAWNNIIARSKHGKR